MENSDKKRKLTVTNIFLIIFFLLITMVAFLSWKNPDIGDKLSIESWFDTGASSASLWAALGFTMLACFLGALIPVPIPYMIPVSTFSYTWIFVTEDPNAALYIIILTMAAAISNTIGDMLDYAIGLGSEKIVERDDPDLQNRWAKLILKKPKVIPWVILLFAVSPLPDSLLLVPLGFIKYPAKKTIFAMFIGKIIMMGAMALAGIFGIEWLLSLVSGESSWITGVVLLYLMWLMVFLMLKFNPKKKEENEEKEE